MEHFTGGLGAAGQPSDKPLSIEDTGGIPTGLAPDIKKQIARRQKRAPLSDTPAQADAPGGEVAVNQGEKRRGEEMKQGQVWPPPQQQYQPHQPPRPPSAPWYTQAWFTILMLVLFFPVGLVLMWLHQKSWHIAVKWVITASFGLVMISGMFSPSQTTTTSDNPSPSVSSTATMPPPPKPLTPAQIAQAKRQAHDEKVREAKAAAAAKRAELQAERAQEEQAREQAAEQKRQDEYNSTHYVNDGLTLDNNSVSAVNDDSGGSYITGKITNTSGTDDTYAEVDYTVYDSSGAVVETAMDNITTLAANDTWRFKCLVTHDGQYTYRLAYMGTSPLGQDNNGDSQDQGGDQQQ